MDQKIPWRQNFLYFYLSNFLISLLIAHQLDNPFSELKYDKKMKVVRFSAFVNVINSNLQSAHKPMAQLGTIKMTVIYQLLAWVTRRCPG